MHGNSKNEDKVTDEDDKKRGGSMEICKAGMKKKSPDDLSQPNQYILII